MRVSILPLQTDRGQQPFYFRADSVGDSGVVRHVFFQHDYLISGWPQGQKLIEYHEKMSKSRPSLVIDAGANIGAASVYFQTMLGDCLVYAIEPDFDNFSILERNTEAYANQINFWGGIASKDGELCFEDPGHSDWGFRTHTIEGAAPEGQRTVQSISPATILADPRLAHTNPLIFKIDIEGAESDLFSGDTSWMARFPMIVMELHDWMLPFTGASSNFFKAMVQHEFDVLHSGENIFLFNRRILGDAADVAAAPAAVEALKAVPAAPAQESAMTKLAAESFLQTGLVLTYDNQFYGEALPFLQKAVALNPGSVPARETFVHALVKRAAVLRQEDKIIETENLLRKALTVSDQPEIRLELASVLLSRAVRFLRDAERPFKAESCIQEALSLRSDFPEAFSLLAITMERQKSTATPAESPDVVEVWLRRDLASNQNMIPIITALQQHVYNQAVESFNALDYAEAECGFRKVMAINPAPPVVDGLVRALCKVAADLFLNLRPAEAEAALWEALSLRPDDAEANEFLPQIAGLMSKRVNNIIDSSYRDCMLDVRKMLQVKDIVGYAYVRKGGPRDGGYVMVDHGLQNTVVYSLGIGGDVSWDWEMAEQGCQIYQYDHTIEHLPAEHPNFHWSKLGVASSATADPVFRTLPDLIAANGHQGRKDLVLKIDIERSEWQMLAEMPEETLCQFFQIVGEFHSLQRVIDPEHRDVMMAALKKLDTHFQVVHAHANNMTGMFMISGVPMYYCMELTFVRRADHQFVPTTRLFPTTLDHPCHPSLVDLFLGEFGG